MTESEDNAGGGGLYGPDAITGALPHRFPFLFVDRVVETEPGRSATAYVSVTADTPYFGRTGNAALPDVLILEAMAQVGAISAAGKGGAGRAAPTVRGYLAAINDAEFRGRAYPGDTVMLKLGYVARMGSMVRFNGSAVVDGKEIVSCGLTFTVGE